jgi:hypothetical protein
MGIAGQIRRLLWWHHWPCPRSGDNRRDCPIAARSQRCAFRYGWRRAAFLAAADVALASLRDLPAFDGMLRTKILDAWARERPVIVSARGKSCRIVREADGGICTEPEKASRYRASHSVSAGQSGNAPPHGVKRPQLCKQTLLAQGYGRQAGTGSAGKRLLADCPGYVIMSAVRANSQDLEVFGVS